MNGLGRSISPFSAKDVPATSAPSIMRGLRQATPSNVGNALADNILHDLTKLDAIDHPSLEMRTRTVLAPFAGDHGGTVARAHETLAKMGQSSRNLLLVTEAWKGLNIDRFRTEFGQNLPMEVDAIRIDDNTAIVFLPHEIFVELGLAIKKASPFKHTFVVTLANDIDFYVPTKKAFAEGSYEVVASAVKPGSGEMLVESATALLHELRP